MTMYSKEDLQGWEFKIVRAATQRFGNPEALRRVCEEEAANGWELLEKFDNSRLRFKRPVERRSSDTHAATDPYRSQVGVSEGQIVVIVLTALAVFCLLAVFLFAK